MAIPSQEVEILKEGVDNRAPTNSSFALNLIHRRGAFEVRDGFGQLAQRTTSLNMPMPFNKDFGINEHVASTVMNTNFGHVQIVSLFKASVNTANTTSNTPNTIAWYNNFRESLYSIHIDDITDGTHWEEILYTHTARS